PNIEPSQTLGEFLRGIVRVLFHQTSQLSYDHRTLGTHRGEDGSLKGGRWAALRVDCFAQQFLCALGCLIAAGTFGRCFGVFGMFRQSQLTFWVRNGEMDEVDAA